MRKFPAGAAFKGVSERIRLPDLERGEGAEVLGVPQDGVPRQLLLVAAGEGAVEAGEGVHGWRRGRVVEAAAGAEESVDLGTVSS
jgi:hypothetical protein